MVAVFDADQVARPNFFTRTLPWLQDGRESVVLTPQFFHNFDVNTDIFSHRQAAYWGLILPGQVSVQHSPEYAVSGSLLEALELSCRPLILFRGAQESFLAPLG